MVSSVDPDWPDFEIVLPRMPQSMLDELNSRPVLVGSELASYDDLLFASVNAMVPDAICTPPSSPNPRSCNEDARPGCGEVLSSSRSGVSDLTCPAIASNSLPCSLSAFVRKHPPPPKSEPPMPPPPPLPALPDYLPDLATVPEGDCADEDGPYWDRWRLYYKRMFGCTCEKLKSHNDRSRDRHFLS